MPRIPLTSDRKRKVDRLCWAFNCREVFAEEFNLQIRDGHFTSKLYAANNNDYKTTQKSCVLEEGQRNYRKKNEREPADSNHGQSASEATASTPRRKRR